MAPGPLPHPAPISGGNALVNTPAASSLLALVGQLRGSTTHPDVSSLHAHVAQEIRNFENEARAVGLSPETVLAARYALCSLLDETVLSTPWGADSPWAHQTLLIGFHKEAWGGEKYFQILERLLQQPANNLDLLEFMYLCLALGFEGKYRVQERGRDALEQVKDNLYRVIRNYRGDFERGLSPHWRGVEDRRNKLARFVPLWVIGAGALALIIAMYAGFFTILEARSHPVYTQVRELGGPSRVMVDRGPKPLQQAFDLREHLGAEERTGVIALTPAESPDTVVVYGTGLFASGSSTVEASSYPLLRRIAEVVALAPPGTVLVTGHTDSMPIRFGSNVALSEQRAQAVVQILREYLGAKTRLVGEGRGATQAIAPNDSAANRARNRRVEVTLISLQGRS